MRKIFITALFSVITISATSLLEAKPIDNNNAIYISIDSIFNTADSLYKTNHKDQSFALLKQIIDFYQTNKNECLQDDRICKIIFEAYSSYCVSPENAISTVERTKNLDEALNLVALNPKWIANYPQKQNIVNNYIYYIGLLIESDRTGDAQCANQAMLHFAEQYYKIGFSDVIISACSMNSLMGNFDQNIPLYEKLYEMFEDLDPLQQYKVVKELIHTAFKAEKNDKVIALATKHEKLIQQTNDEVKDAVLDLISLSFEKTAFKIEDTTSADRYSVEVNDAYLTGYNWTKVNNKAFLPRSIIYWGYYKYKWDNVKDEAILLFYELLDLLQNKDIEEPIFDAYCEIEDAQQAIISIIVTQIINASTPIDIERFITKYDRVFIELIGSKNGQYYSDLINAIETAYTICYGKQTIDE